MAQREPSTRNPPPKEVFPSLLAKLWKDVSHVVEKNLQSGFRKAGLCPFNPEEVLKMIPDAVTSTEENVGRILDQSLITLLQQNRGRNDQQKPRRGRKVQPGVAITVADCSPNLDPSKKNPGSAAKYIWSLQPIRSSVR
ncbi:hypothetical protein HOLleu_10171 [Holothuria leucospilota]|uniref:Uncharacterized protein n=1 Tax=Holothuria leucospilota TaxID=206669 RepID=A0A9Q1CDY8_HOLLE|nr:hypothetical protein HOLleu_10171 [Holothuria leucospilota]